MIHGIEEDKDEITDDVVVNMLQEKLKLDISKKDINKSYRIKTSSPRKKILVKFVWYNDCHKNFTGAKIDQKILEFL